MCGFLGAASINRNIKSNLIDGLNKIKHRGPDQIKFHFGDDWALGFARLSILDLSELGSQPMVSEDSQIIITFNGELYNYLELKKDLEQSGYLIKSKSDTEILLKYYQYLKGDINKLLTKCNGMFALAIIDKSKDRLILARDRLGVKPLYFSYINQSIYFGSEIKGLKEIIPRELSISKNAIMAYLNIGFVPFWLSIYNEIDTLKPGTYANFNLKTNNLKVTQYWRPEPKSNLKNRSEEYYKIKINELLEDATKIRLNSDVPLSLFLSGGVDSGLVAAKISSLGNNNIVANTIRFRDWKNDESILAQSTADHLGIKLYSHDAEILNINNLVDIIGHFDEPFADQSAIVTSLVSEKASQQSTVILTGDGGDESFAGYREYNQSKKLDFLRLFPDPILKLIGIPFSFLENPLISRIGKRLMLTENARSAWTHIYPYDTTLEKLLNEEWKKDRSFDPEIGINNLKLNKNWDSLLKAQVADLKIYLPDNVLKKVDQMSMKHSVEVRSPLLDYRLVELGLSIPSSLKLKNGVNKYMLREVGKDLLPQNVINAPKKGFGIPLAKYLYSNGKIQKEIQQKLDLLAESDWFNRKKYLKTIYSNKINPIYIYRLLCLQIWKEKNKIK